MANKIKDIIKRVGPVKLGAICLCGILLLVVSSRTGEELNYSTAHQKTTEASTYKEQCEEQLEKILKQIEGVGKVEVMITVSQNENREYIPEGIVVVCEGGEDSYVKREVTSVAEALFPVESHKIKVMNLRR